MSIRVPNEPGDRPAVPARKRRSDGERSRDAILRASARLATVEGIGGLSIGRLAEAVGMSKSGLFAHFGSKEELQLATIEAARVLFDEDVVEPALAASTGIERLNGLVENFMEHLEAGVYPGGCFFAAVMPELNMQPGAVRDRALAFTTSWLGHIETAVRDAQAEGAIDPSEDAGQLMFEIEAAMMLANAMFVISQESTPLERCRRAVAHRLAEAAPKAA
jgi:AcrR family transcriptional regulator